MGGGSSALDMINSLRFNKNQLNKESRFKKEWGLAGIEKSYTKKESGQLYFKSPTKKEMLEVRRDILVRKRNERLVMFGLWASLFVFVVCGSYYVLTMSAPRATPVKKEMGPSVEEVKNDRYSYFIGAGDAWMGQNKWYNAAFEYKKALEVYPGNYTAKYRLATAYAYHCQTEGTNCEAFISLINGMVSSYPDKNELYELRASYYYHLGDSALAESDLAKADSLGDLMD
jgi:predicted Zn-dependent protease